MRKIMILFFCLTLAAAGAAAATGAANVMEKGAATELNIGVGERTFTAILLDGAGARALKELLPMTLDMSEMNGNEKYNYLPYGLPADPRVIGSVRAGDLMLYGSDCLVLFYGDFQTSYSYTRLGRVENTTGLADALGEGSVSVTFSAGGL